MPVGQRTINLPDPSHRGKELQPADQYLQQGLVAKETRTEQIGPARCAAVA